MAHALMGHRQGSKLENWAVCDCIQGQFLLGEHHIRARIVIEGKIPIPIGKGFHKGQRGAEPPVKHQVVHANACFFRHIPEKMAPSSCRA